MKRKSKSKKTDKRRDPRVEAALPVELPGEWGLTRDVSGSGMFFETDAPYAVGSTVELALNLDTPWGKVLFRCHGKIIRLESQDTKVGVAVQFTDSTAAPIA